MTSQNASGVRIVATQEVPEMPQMTTPPTSPPKPMGLTQVFTAISMVLSARLLVLILLGSAIMIGSMVVNDPTPLRLYAGAGYSVFTLAFLGLLTRMR